MSKQGTVFVYHEFLATFAWLEISRSSLRCRHSGIKRMRKCRSFTFAMFGLAFASEKSVAEVQKSKPKVILKSCEIAEDGKSAVATVEIVKSMKTSAKGGAQEVTNDEEKYKLTQVDGKWVVSGL